MAGTRLQREHLIHDGAGGIDRNFGPDVCVGAGGRVSPGLRGRVSVLQEAARSALSRLDARFAPAPSSGVLPGARWGSFAGRVWKHHGRPLRRLLFPRVRRDYAVCTQVRYFVAVDARGQFPCVPADCGFKYSLHKRRTLVPPVSRHTCAAFSRLGLALSSWPIRPSRSDVLRGSKALALYRLRRLYREVGFCFWCGCIRCRTYRLFTSR